MATDIISEREIFQLYHPKHLFTQFCCVQLFCSNYDIKKNKHQQIKVNL